MKKLFNPENANDTRNTRIELRNLKHDLEHMPDLDDNGKIPSRYLPAYVDDVLEFDTFADFPETGESGIIYVDLSTGASYRWSGTQYTILNYSPEEIQALKNTVTELHDGLLNGDFVPAMAETLAPWADQKAIATPDTYTDAVRTTGGDIPIETSAGSKLESIKPVAGSKWTAKMLFNGSYNMLNAAKWGAANSQPYVGGVGDDFIYFLVPELTLGTFGTADENNGLLFTDEDGENVEPTSVYFKPLGATVPQSLTDGTSITPTSVSYDGNTYKDYATDDAGWLIIPKTYYDNDVCAHIAWEDWYDKHVSLDAPTTNPEAVVGVLILEGLLALAHSDKYLRGINEEVCDNAVFGETSSTITHMVDELSVVANAWTNSATGESDSQGNALYRHSATVSGIKQGGAACIEGEDGGIPLIVNGTTVSYIDTNAAAPASVVFYQIPTTEVVEKAYTDSVFSGSNIDTETGVLPINDCSIEAQVAMDGKANITVKYAKNIVDQVAINATVDVPQIKREVKEHEERITELEDTAVRTGSYDASVAVGLADNFKGDTVVNAEFYKRKTGGTQSIGSGIAAIKEVRGKSFVWNQIFRADEIRSGKTQNGVTYTNNQDGTISTSGTAVGGSVWHITTTKPVTAGHKYLFKCTPKGGSLTTYYVLENNAIGFNDTGSGVMFIGTTSGITLSVNVYDGYNTDGLIFKPRLFDLTLMFGAGNEPATVEEFEKMFPLDYYDYNAGEVVPFAGQNLVTIGKNQYNPATGKANLLGGQQYQISGTYTGATIDGVAVTLDSNNCFTTTKDCVLNITGGNDTDTFVGLYSGETNTFEPYEKHTLPLDPSQWRDKQGNLVFPYGGMHGVGTAYDYAKVDADGYIRKAVRCFEQVDLGNLSWSENNTDVSLYAMLSYDLNNIIKKAQDNTIPVTYIICPIYTVYDRNHVAYAGGSSGVYANDYAYGIGVSTSGQLIIANKSYTDAAAFKAAMQGVPLYYELAEPIEVELATPVYAKYLVDKDGTEEITPANGATPYTTPANLSILYAMDARGEIKNLPKNYISAASMDKFLIKLGVVTNGTWSKTYNTQAQDYDFDFVPNPEPEEINN